MDSREPSPYFIRRNSFAGGATETAFTVLPELPVNQVDLKECWRILKKHLWLLISLPLACAVLIGLRDLMVTRLYTAKATILIKSNAPPVYQYTSMDQSGADEGQASQWKVDAKTEYTLLKSRSLAEKVIITDGLLTNRWFVGVRPVARAKAEAAQDSDQDTDWERVPEPLINRYLSALNVVPIEDTELVTVAFTTPRPDLSARLANAHVQEFIQQGIELNSAASDQAARFLQRKLADLKRQLEESELALNNYRRAKGIIPGLISVNGNQDVILERLNKMSDQVEKSHLENLALESEVALVDQGHADALPAVIGSHIVQSLKQDLDSLQARYASMSSQYRPDYLPMTELAAKTNETRNALKHEMASIVASVRARYGASVKNEQVLEQELKHEKDFALGLNDAAVKYAILQREADTNRALYNAVLMRMKDVEVTADLHASNMSVVDQATIPTSPSSPQTGRDLLAALLLGLFASIGIAFILERQNDTFKTPEEMEPYLRVPHLATIPDWRRSSGRFSYGRGISRGRELKGPAAFSIPPMSYGAHSPAGEAYRMLRTGLILSRAGAPPKSVLISSALPGEGKTTTTANLALVLAHTGRKVLLVDGDLRRPSSHDFFGMNNQIGLTEVLAGVAEVQAAVRGTGFDNLCLLSAGETPPNPSELLGSDKMRELLVALGLQFDCVVVDSAPVMAVTDAVVISGLVDGVILVANAHTSRQQTRSALLRLEYAHAKIFGVVLNQFNSASGFGYKNTYYTYRNAPTSSSNEAEAHHDFSSTSAE